MEKGIVFASPVKSGTSALLKSQIEGYPMRSRKLGWAWLSAGGLPVILGPLLHIYMARSSGSRERRTRADLVSLGLKSYSASKYMCGRSSDAVNEGLGG